LSHGAQSGLDAWVDTEGGRFALSSQRYGPDVVHPDGERGLEAFGAEPGGQFLIKDLALLGISLWSLGEAWGASDRQVARRG